MRLPALVLALSAAGTVAAVADEADFTPLLASAAAWDSPTITEGWARTRAQGARIFRTRASPCRMFGRAVTSATGCFESGRLTSISLVFLDSGTWFGYVPDDEAKAVESARAPEFARLFSEISDDVFRKLTAAAGSGAEATLGTTPWLKHQVTLFDGQGASGRLAIIPDQLVKLVLFREAADARELLAPARRIPDKRSQISAFLAGVRSTPEGDRLIDSLPVFPQGDRAYCGVSTLAVAMQFCGLTLDTEDFAAGAKIRFGSTRKSHIREVYVAAAKEAALQMFHSTKFEFTRAQRTIDAGLPVLVFRRWNQEREYLHTAFARRFGADRLAELPRADANDRKTWPVRDGYAHASVINGYNAKRQEVIFSESWNEFARNRRMRREELEATAYLAYYPRL